jgi:O-antigen/teichoic acid export membrane protein
MLKILKSSVRDTVIYSVGTFASKLAGFILVPLYTNKKFLSETDFGVLNLAEANLQIVISVLGLGLNWAYERWYWDQEQIPRRKSIFFTILFTTTFLSLFLVGISFIFSKYFSGWIFDNADYYTIFRLMMINAGFEIIAQTPNSLIRLNEKPGLFTIANLSKLTASVIFTVLFIVKFDLGLYGVYYAQLIGIGFYFLVLSPFILRHIELKFEWAELRNMIWFRFPFLMPIIALNLFNFNDRFVMTKLVGVVDAGIYSLGAKLANTIKVFLITAIWLALTPTIYRMMNDPNNKRFYSKIMTYLSFTVIIVVMLFSFFSKELVALIAKDDIYLQAYQVIPIVSLAIFFGLLKDISMIGLNITKKTGAIASTTIAVSVFNLAMNFALIPFLGMIGAACASLLAQLLFFIVIYRVAQKNYPIPYELGKITLMLVIASSLFVVSLLTDNVNLWLRLPVKLFLVMVFPVILYFFGFYEAVELDRINGFWKKWKNPMTWKQNFDTLKF